MKAFISYTSISSEKATDISIFLKNYGIDSFVANDDIRIGTDWKTVIFQKLKECDFCILLISKEFKTSDWCSQEIGIAYSLNKDFIPISLDGTKSYGFINNIQSKEISSLFLYNIIIEGLIEINYEIGITILIDKLFSSGSFRYSESLFELLMPYIDKLSKTQLDKICDASVNNGQIWDASKCATQYLPSILKKRKSDINAELFSKISYQIKNREWFKEKT